MRFPFRKREKAAFIKLRRQGYTINIIAETFNRSCSVIHRALKRNGLTRQDLRKIPRRIRQLAATRQRYAYHILRRWVIWANGEGDKPP